MGKIVVIGSSNTDLVIKTSRIPRPGETVIGGEFMINAGGKGANQAVAAARLGAQVVFVAKTGDDQFGHSAIEHYQRDGILIDHIGRDNSSASGVALIAVDGAGENSIVVAPGANASLSKEDIDRAEAEIKEADYVLIQLEISLDVVVYAIEKAHAAGVKVVLNPAPAAQLPAEVLAKLWLITPNCTEASLLSGVEVTDRKSALEAAKVIAGSGVANVIVTMGGDGALLLTSEGDCVVPAFRVKAVDTTAAGDIFNGALVTALVEGKNLQEAVRFASAASAIAVTRMGAQTSAPTRAEVDEFLVTR